MQACTAAVRIFAVGVLIVFAGSAAAQQAYPDKPIRMIVPYPPGGSTTTMARLIAQKLTESWGQQVIIDNRGGANTIIGTEALTKSSPDGYTMLLGGSTLVILPSLYDKLPFDVIRDFAPVATLASTELILVVHPAVPANTLQELIALAKSKPGQLNFASAGSGGNPHLMGELLNITAGIKLQHIPYKGTGPSLTDLMGGQVQLAFNNPINVIAHIKNGKMRAIAVTGEHRLSALPEVPTFVEAGLAGINLKTWFGVLAPAGTPAAVVNKLSAEIARIMSTPDTKAKLVSQGLDTYVSTPEQTAALMKADMAKYAKIIKTANIKLEN